MGVGLLLDTHALLWWLWDDEALSPAARAAIEGAETIYVSAASAWEISTKHRLGKLPNLGGVTADLFSVIERQGFITLSISFAHAELSGRLPGSHRDPFNRLLIAQSILERISLVSNERIFDQYAVHRIW